MEQNPRLKDKMRQSAGDPARGMAPADREKAIAFFRGRIDELRASPCFLDIRPQVAEMIEWVDRLEAGRS